MTHSSGRTPGLPDVGVLGLVPDRWGDVWMPRHQILTRLSSYFNVVWLEPAESWRRPWRGPAGPSSELNPGVPDLPGFTALRASPWMPRVHRPRFLGSLVRRVRLGRAVRRLRRLGAERVVLYLWRPEFEDALDIVRHDVSCYHVDDEYSFSTVEGPLDSREAELIGRADRVIFHSPGLWEKKAHLSAHAFQVPNGVDFRAFATPAEEPEDLKRVPRPRIGYVGVVKHFLDVPLLFEVARRRRDWSITVVGPVYPMGVDSAPFEELRELPNVYLLGGKRLEELPAYAQHLDVGILPYDVDGYTKFIYPLKLHEYLAAGIPVVGTPIRTLMDFEPTIAIAASPDDWCQSIGAALRPEVSTPESIASRRSVAQAHDWDILTRRVAVILAEALGSDVAQRLESVAAPES